MMVSVIIPAHNTAKTGVYALSDTCTIRQQPFFEYWLIFIPICVESMIVKGNRG